MSPATVELTTANKTDWDDLLWAPVSQLGLFFNSSLFQETWEDIIAVVQPFFPPIGARPGEADISVSKEERGSWSDQSVATFAFVYSDHTLKQIWLRSTKQKQNS